MVFTILSKITNQLYATIDDIISSIFILPILFGYIVAFIVGTIVLTLVGFLITYIATALLLLLSLFLFFIPGMDSVVNFLVAIIFIGALCLVQVFIGNLAIESISTPDGDLVCNPSNWHRPVTVPLLGIVPVILFTDVVFSPWTSVLELIAAGVIAGFALYHGSLYPVMMEKKVRNRHRYNSLQLRLLDILPNGYTVGRAAFTLGVVWLTTALMFWIIILLMEGVATDLLELISALPFLPPSNNFLTAFPIIIGISVFGLYGLRESLIVYIHHRRTIIGRASTIYNYIASASIRVWRVVKTAIHFCVSMVNYTLLLRPR